MSANTYLPLAAGLAAPLIVLCLVWATRRAGALLRERRAEQGASRARSSARKPGPKRALVVAAIASTVALAAAVALAVSDRQAPGSVMTGSEEATVPTASTPPPPRPAPRPQNNGGKRERRKPARVAAAVVNAAGVQGLAASKSRVLRRKGFKVRGTSTAPTQRTESVVFFAKGKARGARMAARALRIRSREPDDQQVDASGQGADVIVVLGTDEAGTLPSTRDSSYTSTSTVVDN